MTGNIQCCYWFLTLNEVPFAHTQRQRERENYALSSCACVARVNAKFIFNVLGKCNSCVAA